MDIFDGLFIVLEDSGDRTLASLYPISPFSNWTAIALLYRTTSQRTIELKLNYHGFRQTGEDVNKEIKP
ncbi:MAG TPA: hypothetical protein DD761_09970 [Cyanobacteria bacterium UBA11691]|nr:hypothetical protein [Cyanobacteria bacterium UBA11691]